MSIIAIMLFCQKRFIKDDLRPVVNIKGDKIFIMSIALTWSVKILISLAN